MILLTKLQVYFPRKIIYSSFLCTIPSWLYFFFFMLFLQFLISSKISFISMYKWIIFNPSYVTWERTLFLLLSSMIQPRYEGFHLVLLYLVLSCWMSSLEEACSFLKRIRRRNRGCEKRRWGWARRSVGIGTCVWYILYKSRGFSIHFEKYLNILYHIWSKFKASDSRKRHKHYIFCVNKYSVKKQ